MSKKNPTRSLTRPEKPEGGWGPTLRHSNAAKGGGGAALLGVLHIGTVALLCGGDGSATMGKRRKKCGVNFFAAYLRSIRRKWLPPFRRDAVAQSPVARLMRLRANAIRQRLFIKGRQQIRKIVDVVSAHD